MIDNEDFTKWARLHDCWSERDLIDLCCGRLPGEALPSDAETNAAQQAIGNAVLAGTLKPLDNAGATHGDKVYLKARNFKPLEAASWAAQKFDKFPRTLVEATNKEAQVGGSTKWPWGDHETELLRKLAEAADQFWKLYDQDDESTAPTNKQVTNWLTSNGVAKRTAEVMATILRADGLKTGPRK